MIISCHGLTRTASTTSVWKISVWSILTSWRVPDFDFCKHLSVLYRRHAVKPQFYSLVIIVIDIIFQVFDEGPCCHSLLSLMSPSKSLARMMQQMPSGSHCLRYPNWPLTMQKSCGMRLRPTCVKFSHEKKCISQIGYLTFRMRCVNTQNVRKYE